MASLQQPDGHIRYMESRELNGVWMTSYATPAFAGQALPIPLVPGAEPEEPARRGIGKSRGHGQAPPIATRPRAAGTAASSGAKA